MATILKGVNSGETVYGPEKLDFRATGKAGIF
jgi:hypothetical protein